MSCNSLDCVVRFLRLCHASPWIVSYNSLDRSLLLLHCCYYRILLCIGNLINNPLSLRLAVLFVVDAVNRYLISSIFVCFRRKCQLLTFQGPGENTEMWQCSTAGVPQLGGLNNAVSQYKAVKLVWCHWRIALITLNEQGGCPL